MSEFVIFYNDCNCKHYFSIVVSTVHAFSCEEQDLNGEWNKVGTYSCKNLAISIVSENKNFMIFENWMIISKSLHLSNLTCLIIYFEVSSQNAVWYDHPLNFIANIL